MKIMLLGANGRLASKLIETAPPEYEIVKIARKEHADGRSFSVADFSHIPPRAFHGVRCIVNCAGVTNAPSAQLAQANQLMPTSVARQGLCHGIKHFVQISSFSIFGKAETVGLQTPILPISAYGKSKAAAEAALNILENDGLKPALLRVPIIYDHSAKTKLASLARLMSITRWFIEPRPVPRRAMIHIENCATLIHHIVRNQIAGPIFGADLEMFEINSLAKAFNQVGKNIEILRVPNIMLTPLAIIAPALHASLFRSSVLRENENTCRDITLPKTLRDGLLEMVRNL